MDEIGSTVKRNSRKPFSRKKTGNSADQDPVVQMDCNSPGVVRRLSRIEENYLSLDELLTHLEHELPDDEQLDGPKPRKPR